MGKKLCVLITNITLKARTGTETVVRDLSLGLREAGHYPMVYSPTLGDIACEIAAAGIPVVDNLRRVPREPDIIHGHHRFETIQALAHFSGACGIFVCHDRLSWHDAPPWYPRILRYVAVDLNCRERLSENRRIPDDRMRVI
ncbi:MAG: glycosyltransferase family 4 protein [Thermodesulfovibrionales bacterium]